ncbi:element excision factor XisH family protein [Nostoc sp.]|uniref:element excision factor XisH family protein n=1 Tax=Nostoc sp. TaxID=1180 RepID=UPI003FA602DE
MSVICDSTPLSNPNGVGATYIFLYILYYDILARLESDRRLYLAIRQETYSELFQEPIGKILLENQRLCLLVFDSKREVVLQWIP